MDQQILFNRLLNLIKIFKSRPYHLTKYLIDNNSLDIEFLNKVYNNKKLDDSNIVPSNFKSISDMNNFFNSMLLDFDPEKITNEELSDKLNSKLNYFIKNELYEDAIRIRDYMISNNIKRI